MHWPYCFNLLSVLGLVAGDISASVKAVSDTLKHAFEASTSDISQTAEQQLADQLKAADSTLHGAAEDVASKLPKNNSILYASRTPVCH